MAQYDVFLNPEGQGDFVEIQASLFARFRTAVVVPLDDRSDLPFANPELNPKFCVTSRGCILLPQLLLSLPREALGAPVADLSAEQDRIKSALNLLFLGF